PVVGRRSLESGTMSKPPFPLHAEQITRPPPSQCEHFFLVDLIPTTVVISPPDTSLKPRPSQLSHKTFRAPSHVRHSYPLTNGSCTISMRSACASISSVPSF